MYKDLNKERRAGAKWEAIKAEKKLEFVIEWRRREKARAQWEAQAAGATNIQKVWGGIVGKKEAREARDEGKAEAYRSLTNVPTHKSGVKGAMGRKVEPVRREAEARDEGKAARIRLVGGIGTDAEIDAELRLSYELRAARIEAARFLNDSTIAMQEAKEARTRARVEKAPLPGITAKKTLETIMHARQLVEKFLAASKEEEAIQPAIEAIEAVRKLLKQPSFLKRNKQGWDINNE